EGMTLIARDRKGKAIGTLGLSRNSFWYSDATYLQDAWLYVAPKNRRNTVGKMLLRGAQAIADASGLVLFVKISNPNRRPKATAKGLVAQDIGYVPAAYTLRMT